MCQPVTITQVTGQNLLAQGPALLWAARACSGKGRRD
jgi:hypothetical protein